MLKKDYSSVRKEKIKKIRTVFEFICLAALVAVFVMIFFNFKRYNGWNSITTQLGDQEAFALQIPGVGRIQTEDCLSIDSLETLLKELKHQGYSTITQDEAKAFYEKSEEIPEKSVFLIFQDCKRDTAELAQPVLEKYNFKATMLEAEQDSKGNKERYLSESDKSTLKKSTFWEIGIDEKLLAQINPVQVDPCWGVNHLLLELGFNPENINNSLTGLLPKELSLEKGYADLEENRFTLTTDENGTGIITVNPDEQYVDAHITAEFLGDFYGTQQVGMRVTKDQGVYIRVTADEVQLIQKSQGKAELLDAMLLSLIEKRDSDGYEVDIRLSGSGITVYVNNKIIFNNEHVYVTKPGNIMLLSSSRVNGLKGKDKIYDMQLKDLSIIGDGDKIYDGRMKWHDKILHAGRELKRDFTAWIQQTGH